MIDNQLKTIFNDKLDKSPKQKQEGFHEGRWEYRSALMQSS